MTFPIRPSFPDSLSELPQSVLIPGARFRRAGYARQAVTSISYILTCMVLPAGVYARQDVTAISSF